MPKAHMTVIEPGAHGAAVPLQVLGRSGFTARYDWEGVYALASSRQPRDVRGRTLSVRFEIVDKRLRSGTAFNSSRGPYTVSVSLQVCFGTLIRLGLCS